MYLNPADFCIFFRHIGSTILNFSRLNSDSWLATPKTSEYQISSQSSKFCILVHRIGSAIFNF